MMQQHFDPRDTRASARHRSRPSAQTEQCRQKFLRAFPAGFSDPVYLERERAPMWSAHERYCKVLRRGALRSLIDAGDYEAVARHAIAIEERARLLRSHERMALREAVRGRDAARAFAEGLFAFLHGRGDDRIRFEAWTCVLQALPRARTRVLTWPTLTVFPFFAQPGRHMVVRPSVVRRAAAACGHELRCPTLPGWDAYSSTLEFAERLRADSSDLGPRDMIDLHAFMRVLGSPEYV